ncbi:hypothetical protein [Serratia surfactantfaciens]|uniref:Uncharacterized protein n=1 Tax=Serratia surfactantfaciens TaxID=2741499 RepID=A0ABS0LTE8_9GAMM|nr:hypothetical protein [Serratia surfactantfaciens]MBH1918606.1 hypothetical protein [Serratia surfactantfaciens]
MSKYTFVVEFEDGKEPGVGFGTKILGGKLCMVAFEDIRKYQLEEEEAYALKEFIGDHQADFTACCEENEVSGEAIHEKLRHQS